MHPTRFGLLGGIVVIVFWAALWAWFLIGVANGGAEKQSRQHRELPKLARSVTSDEALIG